MTCEVINEDVGFFVLMGVIAIALLAAFIWGEINDTKPGPFERLDIKFQKRRDRERRIRRRGDR